MYELLIILLITVNTWMAYYRTIYAREMYELKKREEEKKSK